MYKLTLDNFYQIKYLQNETSYIKIVLDKPISIIGLTCLYYHGWAYLIKSDDSSETIKCYLKDKLCINDYICILSINDIHCGIEEQLWTLLSNLDNSNPKLIESIVKML